MQRTTTFSRLGQTLIAATRGFCTSTSKSGGDEKILASVLFERLPVVVSKIDPVVYAFQEFSWELGCDFRFRWGQQYRREYPEALLKKSDARGQGDLQFDFTPAPRITEADKANDKRSLERALDRRLYLIIFGTSCGSNGVPVWHFPEKVYESEETLRKCAESALASVIGDLSHTYFVGNAPMGHMVLQPSDNEKVDKVQKVIHSLAQPFHSHRCYYCHTFLLKYLNILRQQFFFKSLVVDAKRFNIEQCEDYVWVTKDELLEYFPEQAEYLNKMIIS
ncbi:hypothetical protein ACS0TY_019334 [Phlomoides rotata]